MADDNDSSDPWSKEQRFRKFRKWWHTADAFRGAEDLQQQSEEIFAILLKKPAEKTTVVLVQLKKERASDQHSHPSRQLIQDREPTLQDLIEQVKAPGHDEVYAIFRKRDVSRLDDDRLPDVLEIADDLEDACKALLRVAGIDDVEAETLGLDKFTGGNIMDLCHRLGEITGDVYEVAPHERPKSRKPV